MGLVTQNSAPKLEAMEDASIWEPDTSRKSLFPQTSVFKAFYRSFLFKKKKSFDSRDCFLWVSGFIYMPIGQGRLLEPPQLVPERSNILRDILHQPLRALWAPF